MKVISVWSLEREDCQIFNSVFFEEGRYTLSFTCGLVVSSKFFSRLTLGLKERSVQVHRAHHSSFHRAEGPYGLIAYAWSESNSASVSATRKRVQCGIGCGEFNERSKILILDRSDITDEPLARIREDGTVYTLRLTVANQLLCSCMASKETSSGQVCGHVIRLLTGNSRGVTWNKKQAKDFASKVVKRRMLFDDG